MPIDLDILDREIDRQDEPRELSARPRYALEREGIRTFRQLCSLCEAELLRWPNFGRVSLKEIRAMLKKRGLWLGMAIEEVETAAASEYRKVLERERVDLTDKNNATFFEFRPGDDASDVRACCQNCGSWYRHARSEVGDCILEVRDQTYRLSLCSRFVDK